MSCVVRFLPIARTADLGRRRRAFSLVELLVSLAVVLFLSSMALTALSSARGSGRKLHTRSLISRIDAIIAAQYASYASRSVEATSDDDRGAKLRAFARGDLPDQWGVVAELASKPESELTAHQRAYVGVWNSLGAQATLVDDQHASAECLFLAVMHGGLVDCLDCNSLHIEVGDADGDGMPEFLDAWNNPIGFVLAPSGLQLPAGSGKAYFSSVLPFAPVVVTSLDAKGGMMRPLIVSAGPDREFGLEADASPSLGSTASRDNLTNFDEEARQ